MKYFAYGSNMDSARMSKRKMTEVSEKVQAKRYPDHYDRIRVSVQKVNGKKVEAITYIAQPVKIRDGLKPSKAYWAHLLAARDFLSNSYYESLLSKETLD